MFFFLMIRRPPRSTLSLHDALPICRRVRRRPGVRRRHPADGHRRAQGHHLGRSEEHTSELQSRQYLVCRLLLEKKKKENRTKEKSQQDTQITTGTVENSRRSTRHIR